MPILLVHKMTEKQVKKEISQAAFGLKFKRTIGVLPRQHIVIFEKPVAGKPKPARKQSATGQAGS